MIFLAINATLAIIPALLLVFIFYRKDNRKREPGCLLWKTFLLGFFSVIPALLLELLLDPVSSISPGWLGLILKAFVIISLVEEGTKLLAVRLYIFPKPAFDEVNDGIVYTITVSMGFACFENIMYSFGPLSTILIRGITAVPIHAFASGIMGYYLGKSRFSSEKYILKGFLWAVLIHGLYDVFLFAGGLLTFMVFPLLIVSGKILFSLTRKAIEEDRLAGRS